MSIEAGISPKSNMTFGDNIVVNKALILDILLTLHRLEDRMELEKQSGRLQTPELSLRSESVGPVHPAIPLVGRSVSMGSHGRYPYAPNSNFNKKFEFHDSGSDLRYALEETANVDDGRLGGPDPTLPETVSDGANSHLPQPAVDQHLCVPRHGTRYGRGEDEDEGDAEDRYTASVYSLCGSNPYHVETATATPARKLSAAKLTVINPHAQHPVLPPALAFPSTSTGNSVHMDVAQARSSSASDNRSNHSPTDSLLSSSIAYSQVSSAPWSPALTNDNRDATPPSSRTSFSLSARMSISGRSRRKSERSQERLARAFQAYDAWKEQMLQEEEAGRVGRLGETNWPQLGARHVVQEQKQIVSVDPKNRKRVASMDGSHPAGSRWKLGNRIWGAVVVFVKKQGHALTTGWVLA